MNMGQGGTGIRVLVQCCTECNTRLSKSIKWWIELKRGNIVKCWELNSIGAMGTSRKDW